MSGSRAPARRPLSLMVLAALAAPFTVFAAPAAVDPAAAMAPVEFNSAFTQDNGRGKVDLSRFERGNVAASGTYTVDLMLNGDWKGRQAITFHEVTGQVSAQPCFDRTLLASLGIDLKRVDQDAAPGKKLPGDTLCGDLGGYITDASLTYDPNELSLSLSVPQVYVNRSARGYVDPSQWDKGVNAGILNYNFNTFTTSSVGRTTTSSYLGVNAGVNLGDWRLRHTGSFNWNSDKGASYQRNQTYVQRDLVKLQSQLVIGETNTDGKMFDSVRVRGVSMYTDDRMLPDSQTGYAPIVRGVADTNARVVVKQRGVEIANITVPAGPFEINDLYPSGFGGDLDVTVTEADGRIKQFTVPYSATVDSLRPGYSRYSATVGQLNELNLRSHPYVAQGTWQHGFNNAITGYTGATLANGYSSVVAGAALNTRVGAFSLDVTTARTTIPGQGTKQGQSYQARYSKTMGETGSSFSVGAYRYSTDGYLGLLNAMQLRDAAANGTTQNVGVPRSRFDVTLSQNLGRWGTLYATGSTQDYQNSASKSLNYSVGYSNTWKSVTFGLSAQRTHNIFDNSSTQDKTLADFVARRSRTSDTQYNLTMSVPLGKAQNAPTMRNSVMHASNGSTQLNSAVTGTLGKDQQLSYNVSLGHTSGGIGSSSTNVNANATYQTSAATLNAGYAQGTGYRGVSVGASGGVVVVDDGVHFSQALGDTIGVVKADGAKGATLTTARGVKLDSRGTAVVPYLVPYRLNDVGLDPKGTSHNVELQTTSQKVAPKLGAVVKLSYDTVTGRAAIIKLTQASGEPLPFGADVFDADNKHVGVIGQANRAMVRGVADHGQLTVRWGDDAASSCRFDYSLSAESGDEMAVVTAQCVPNLSSSVAGHTAP